MSLLVFYIFFFKQKTAYEMRISDWSSDVCSSDLRQLVKRTVMAEVHLDCVLVSFDRAFIIFHTLPRKTDVVVNFVFVVSKIQRMLVAFNCVVKDRKSVV